MSAPRATPAKDFSTHWAEVTKLLRAARAHLPLVCDSSQQSTVSDGPLVGSLNEFEEFLEQNELELAWDDLASVVAR